MITFTIVHHPPSPAFAGDTPYVLAVVGLSEGPQMMANLVGPDSTTPMAPGDVTVGMPVRVTFETRGDVAIPQFEPDPEATDDQVPSETS